MLLDFPSGMTQVSLANAVNLWKKICLNSKNKSQTTSTCLLYDRIFDFFLLLFSKATYLILSVTFCDRRCAINFFFSFHLFNVLIFLVYFICLMRRRWMLVWNNLPSSFFSHYFKKKNLLGFLLLLLLLLLLSNKRPSIVYTYSFFQKLYKLE